MKKLAFLIISIVIGILVSKKSEEIIIPYDAIRVRIIANSDNISDLYGDGYNDMSLMFYMLNKRYLHWLSNNPDIAIREKEVLFRRKFYEILKVLGPSMLGCTQQIENRNFLENGSNKEDEKIDLGKKPVIFVSNHGFRDDILSTVLAAQRHGYIFFGSIPLFEAKTCRFSMFFAERRTLPQPQRYLSELKWGEGRPLISRED